MGFRINISTFDENRVHNAFGHVLKMQDIFHSGLRAGGFSAQDCWQGQTQELASAAERAGLKAAGGEAESDPTALNSNGLSNQQLGCPCSAGLNLSLLLAQATAF
jgi:hypothetical protein